MAPTILLTKSTTAGNLPGPGGVEAGELAVNLVDRKIYTKDGSGAIIRLDAAYVDATAPSHPVEGDIWYDTTNNLLKAHNGTSFVSAGYSTLSALEDTTFTSLTTGDYVKYSGTEFVNSSLETDVEALLSAANTGTGHGTLSYANGEYSFAKVTAANIRGEVSATDAGGDGSFAYNSTTGVMTYTGPSAAETQAHFTGGTGIALSSGDISIDFTEFDLDSISEASSSPTNLYFTDARARAAVSVTDAGGDGSLAYNSTTGVFTYTGPSAAEVQAHITGGTGVTVSSGVVSIGQDVSTTSDVTFAKVTSSDVETTIVSHSGGTITLDPTNDGANTGEVIIAGNLTVNGTTTTVNSNTVEIGDAIIVLNSDETGAPSQDAGIEVERGTAAKVVFKWNETDDKWDLGGEELQNVVQDGGTF
jgi:co-chaperonin GroES (HSP10)